MVQKLLQHVCRRWKRYVIKFINNLRPALPVNLSNILPTVNMDNHNCTIHIVYIYQMKKSNIRAYKFHCMCIVSLKPKQLSKFSVVIIDHKGFIIHIFFYIQVF